MIQFMRSTSSAAASQAPLLQAGQPFYEIDTHKLKIGDGSTAWNDLPYIGGSGSTSVSSKNHGKILVVGTSTAGHTADEVDFLCDGVSDQVEIQQALNTVVSVGAGTVLLLNGTYTFDDTVYINHTNVTLMGESQAVVLTGTGDSTTTYGGTMIECLRQDETSALPRRARKIANLSIVSDQRIARLDIQDCILDHVYIDGASENGNDGRGYATNSDYGNVEYTNCYFENCFMCVQLENYSAVHDCMFVNCERCITYGGEYSDCSNNVFIDCSAVAYQSDGNNSFSFNKCVNCFEVNFQNSNDSSFIMIGNIINSTNSTLEDSGVRTTGIIIGNAISGYAPGLTIQFSGSNFTAEPTAIIGNYVNSKTGVGYDFEGNIKNIVFTNNIYRSGSDMQLPSQTNNSIVEQNLNRIS